MKFMNGSLIKSTCLATIFALSCGASTTIAATPPDPATLGQDHDVRWQVLPAWKFKGKAVDMVHSLDGKHLYVLTAENRVEIYTGAGKLLGSIPVAAGVDKIDISPVGDKLYLLNSSDNSFTAQSITFWHDIDTSGAPTKGVADAPVSIVVFTDFQCPYCKMLPPELDKIMEEYDGKVELFFKNLPLISIHPMAKDAALAAISAQNQGKFWEYHDKLFAAEELSPEKLREFAKDIGLDMKQFNKDMEAQQTVMRLQKDMYDAQRAGVDGTPTIFINGWRLGDRSVDAFRVIIDDELKNEKSK